MRQHALYFSFILSAAIVTPSALTQTIAVDGSHDNNEQSMYALWLPFEPLIGKTWVTDDISTQIVTFTWLKPGEILEQRVDEVSSGVSYNRYIGIAPDKTAIVSSEYNDIYYSKPWRWTYAFPSGGGIDATTPRYKNQREEIRVEPSGIMTWVNRKTNNGKANWSKNYRSVSDDQAQQLSASWAQSLAERKRLRSEGGGWFSRALAGASQIVDSQVLGSVSNASENPLDENSDYMRDFNARQRRIEGAALAEDRRQKAETNAAVQTRQERQVRANTDAAAGGQADARTGIEATQTLGGPTLSRPAPGVGSTAYASTCRNLKTSSQGAWVRDQAQAASSARARLPVDALNVGAMVCQSSPGLTKKSPTMFSCDIPYEKKICNPGSSRAQSQ